MAATAAKKDNVTDIMEHGRKLAAKHLEQEEFAYARMAATLPVDWDLKEALNPGFWSNVAYKFAADPMTGRRDLRGSIITLRTADHAWFQQLYVRGVHKNGLIVAPLGPPVKLEPDHAETPNFRTRWNLGKQGWDVIRESDGEIVADASQFTVKEQAQKWIDDTIAAMKD